MNSSSISKSLNDSFVESRRERLGSPSCPPTITPSSTRHLAEPIGFQASRLLPSKSDRHPPPPASSAAALERTAAASPAATTSPPDHLSIVPSPNKPATAAGVKRIPKSTGG